MVLAQKDSTEKAAFFIYEITDINENNTGYTCIYDTGGEDMIIYNGKKFNRSIF